VLDAPNGLEGMKIHNKNCPDLVIIDMIMPVKEGFETIMEMKQKCGQTKIIAISGGGFIVDAENYLQMAKRIGVRHTLEKPIKREQLLEAINELLKNPS
jgi:YesN/AraC family two-component response regulator